MANTSVAMEPSWAFRAWASLTRVWSLLILWAALVWGVLLLVSHVPVAWHEAKVSPLGLSWFGVGLAIPWAILTLVLADWTHEAGPLRGLWLLVAWVAMLLVVWGCGRVFWSLYSHDANQALVAVADDRVAFQNAVFLEPSGDPRKDANGYQTATDARGFLLTDMGSIECSIARELIDQDQRRWMTAEMGFNDHRLQAMELLRLYRMGWRQGCYSADEVFQANALLRETRRNETSIPWAAWAAWYWVPQVGWRPEAILLSHRPAFPVITLQSWCEMQYERAARDHGDERFTLAAIVAMAPRQCAQVDEPHEEIDAPSDYVWPMPNEWKTSASASTSP